MAIKPRRIKANTTTDFLGSWKVMNNTVSDIDKGKIVYVNGVNSSGAFLTVTPFNTPTAQVNAPKFVTGAKIAANGGTGDVRQFYIDVGVDVGVAALDDVVYADSAGGWRVSNPGGSPTKVGVVVKTGATGTVLLAPPKGAA